MRNETLALRRTAPEDPAGREALSEARADQAAPDSAGTSEAPVSGTRAVVEVAAVQGRFRTRAVQVRVVISR